MTIRTAINRNAGKVYKKMIHLLDITLFTVFNPSLRIKISPQEDDEENDFSFQTCFYSSGNIVHLC